MEKGIPPDATIVTEVELVSIKEKTGRFWNIGQNLVIFSSSWTLILGVLNEEETLQYHLYLKYGFCNKSFWKDETLTS